MEVVVTSIQDGFPNWIKKKLVYHELLVLIICVVSFFFGLPNIIQVWQEFGWRIILSQFILYFILGWNLFLPTDWSLCSIDSRHIPGLLPNDRHSLVLWIVQIVQKCETNDGKESVDLFPVLLGRLWTTPVIRKDITAWPLWLYIHNGSPFSFQSLWIFSLINYKKPTYHNGHYEYPDWAHALGWTISCISLVCVPAYALVSIWRAEGTTFMEVREINCCLLKVILKHFIPFLEIQKLDPAEYLRVQDLRWTSLWARLSRWALCAGDDTHHPVDTGPDHYAITAAATILSGTKTTHATRRAPENYSRGPLIDWLIQKYVDSNLENHCEYFISL